MNRLIALLAATLVLAPTLTRAADETRLEVKDAPDARRKLLSVMQLELSRARDNLKLGGYEAPYYIGYQLKDYEQHQVSGRYGAIFSDESGRDRKLYVDVRVGSYELDNSGGDPLEVDFSTMNNYATRKDAPLDDDARALRTALWLITDEKYKAALAGYLKKRSRQVYEVEQKEKAVSFTKETPQKYVQPPVAFSFDRAAAQQLVREVGLLFKAHPEVFDSDVKVEATKQVRYLANTEGTELITEDTIYAIHVQAVARAEDGQLLENSRDYYAATASALPDLQKVKAETREMIAELIALRKAPVIDPYTGPAILAPVATGVLFHEVVGHRLEGDRQDDDKEGRTFKGQEGKAVLPSFLSVIDDPTLTHVGKTTLNGYYRFDEEGVPAQKVALIEKGVLKNFLMSRRAIKGVDKSNGHGRSSGNRPPMARMANLVVESARKVPATKLKQMLLDEARKQGKPYALIIKDITGGNTNTSSYGYQAFKGQPRLVYRVDTKTGKEELVRGVEMVGTPLTTINKIAATGDEVGVFNGYCGAESGYVPVSTVAPAALITELELQRTAKANERTPILPNPLTME
ncbi:MAG: TldD/PmbA family protein [Myxococcales bacterium]